MLIKVVSSLLGALLNLWKFWHSRYIIIKCTWGAKMLTFNFKIHHILCTQGVNLVGRLCFVCCKVHSSFARISFCISGLEYNFICLKDILIYFDPNCFLLCNLTWGQVCYTCKLHTVGQACISKPCGLGPVPKLWALWIEFDKLFVLLAFILGCLFVFSHPPCSENLSFQFKSGIWGLQIC